jgi:hypothetical protein
MTDEELSLHEERLLSPWKLFPENFTRSDGKKFYIILFKAHILFTNIRKILLKRPMDGLDTLLEASVLLSE